MNYNALWLRQVPKKTASTGLGLVTMTDNIGVEASFNLTGLRWAIDNDYTDSYAAFEMNGFSFDYDETNSRLGVINETDGVNLPVYSAGTYRASPDWVTVPEAESYTVIKPAKDTMLFGIESVADGGGLYPNEGILYDVNEILDAIIDASDTSASDFGPGGPSTTGKIQFICEGDTLSSDRVTLLRHSRTLAYAVNSNDFAAVAYLDENGNTKIRIAEGYCSNTDEHGIITGGTRFGGETIISDKQAFDIRDVQFYDDSHALLVDAANNTIWTINIDTTASTVTNRLISTINGLTVGASPVVIALNSNNTRAYVLSEGDESVSVIALAPHRRPQVVLTYALADLFPGKVITITPNTLALPNNHTLAVGSQGTKALLMLDLDALTALESAPASTSTHQGAQTIEIPTSTLTPIQLHTTAPSIAEDAEDTEEEDNVVEF